MYKAGTKLIWVLVIVLAQFIGAVIYLAAGRPTGGSRSLGPSVMDGSAAPASTPASTCWLKPRIGAVPMLG